MRRRRRSVGDLGEFLEQLADHVHTLDDVRARRDRDSAADTDTVNVSGAEVPRVAFAHDRTLAPARVTLTTTVAATVAGDEIEVTIEAIWQDSPRSEATAQAASNARSPLRSYSAGHD